MKETLRHLTSINDLTNEEIEGIFNLAAHYLGELGDPARPHRIAHSTDVAKGRVLAALFYEPSTRTRLSFESAMLRLGGKCISSADPATSSAAKGESLADTVRIVENYADILVIRHPRDGAARLASEYAGVPVVNGGDGAHEHPTQTLCDLFTLTRDNTLADLNVAIQGDLKGSRTIHSFVYALARFGANIMMMPAKGMALPKHVDERLREEFHCAPAPKSAYENTDGAIDALYVTADKPHQLALIAHPSAKIRDQVDVIYVTRFQKERWADKNQKYPRIDTQFLKGPRFAATRVLHPLPRVDELDSALDTDPRAIYFRQASYGVPVRMALIAQLLGLADHGLARFEGGFRNQRETTEEPARYCINPNCIVHDKLERAYVRNKFFVIHLPREKLRCFYCETDIPERGATVGRARKRKRK